MDAGIIAEAGTHTELLERDGLYARMWKRQSEAGDSAMATDAL